MEEEKEVKEVREVLVTVRDRELMLWMNRIGFVTLEMIASKLNVALITAYKRMRKLISLGFLNYQRFYFGMPGVYTVSNIGAEFCGSFLPAMRGISKATYDHDLRVTELLLSLSKKHNAEFTTERELRYQKTQDGIGQLGHIHDAEIFIDEKKIAIEVELSTKGRRRLQTIMNEYMKNFNVHEVWYFCANLAIKKQIEEYQSSCSFLKVFDLDKSHAE